MSIFLKFPTRNWVTTFVRIQSLLAFKINRKNHDGWVVPPVDLIADSINHMKRCNATGTLVIPKRPSAAFWPLLSGAVGFRSFVKGYVEYETPNNLL